MSPVLILRSSSVPGTELRLRTVCCPGLSAAGKPLQGVGWGVDHRAEPVCAVVCSPDFSNAALLSPRPSLHQTFDSLFKLIIFCPVCSLCPGGPADSFIKNGRSWRLSVQQSPRAGIILDPSSHPWPPPHFCHQQQMGQPSVKGLNLH